MGRRVCLGDFRKKKLIVEIIRIISAFSPSCLQRMEFQLLREQRFLQCSQLRDFIGALKGAVNAPGVTGVWGGGRDHGGQVVRRRHWGERRERLEMVVLPSS